MVILISDGEDSEYENTTVTEKEELKSAITILCDSTRRGHNWSTGRLKHQYDILSLPLYYILIKNKPKIFDLPLNPPVPKLGLNSDIEIECEEEALLNTANDIMISKGVWWLC